MTDSLPQEQRQSVPKEEPLVSEMLHEARKLVTLLEAEQMGIATWHHAISGQWKRTKRAFGETT